MNLAEVCEFWARVQPEAVAIDCNGEQLTYGELEARTRRIAAALRDRGVQPGDRVGVLGTNSLAWCEMVIATLRAGGAAVPLNIRCSVPELSHMVDTVDPKVVAYDEQLSGRYAPLAGDRPHIMRVSLDDTAAADVTIAALRAHEGALPGIEITADDPAVIAFTSGTTGHPKGAVLSHGNILATVEQNTRFEQLSTSTKLLCCAPLAFTGGIISNFLVAFGVGGTLILDDFDPARALDLMVNVPITGMYAVPIMWEGIAAAPGFAEADLSALTTAITGGAVVPEPLLRKWNERGVQIRQAYSLTEATASTTVLPHSQFLSRRESAGVPSVHTEVRVVDGDGADMAVGEVGEITVKGPQVFQGYWNNPEATREAIVDGWLRTGDLGTLDADGYLRVVDRKKDMIISGGLNVYPAEIELAVGRFPNVEEAVAIGVAHESWGETVALVVYGEDIDAEKLYAHCRENLADYKAPRYITRAEQPLPRSMSGKILRRVIRDEFDSSTAIRTAAK